MYPYIANFPARKFKYCLLAGLYFLLVGILFPDQILMAGEIPSEVKSELDRLIEMSQINPEDELLKIRIRRYAFERGLPIPDLPISEARDRFQRALLKDNLSVVATARAIEGIPSLEMLRQRIYQLQPQEVEISSLKPFEIRSYDYKAMLEKRGVSPSIPGIAHIVPEDKIYLSFKNFKTFYHFIALWDTFAVPTINHLRTSIYLQDLRTLLESQLGISETMFLDSEWNRAEEIALLFGDLYLHEGTDITLIVQFNQQAAVEAAREILSKDQEENLSKNARAKRFIQSTDRYLIISNNSRVAEKIQTRQGKKLAEAEDFLYLLSLNLPAEDGLFFMGEGFIRKLTGPEFRIKSHRRSRCRLILADLQDALVISSEPVTLLKLVTEGYLPYLPLCPDKGEYRLDASQQDFSCSIHGHLDALTHLESLSIDKVTRIEVAEYEQFKAWYQRYFDRFVDPIGIGIGLKDPFIQLNTVVLSLTHNPWYTRVLMDTGQNVSGSFAGSPMTLPGFFVFRNITPDYGIATAVRSPFLKNILDRGEFWRSRYTYFHHKMRPYLDGNTIFGNELVVGLFDFSFSEGFPKNLKELAQVRTEIPLFFIQNLEDEGKAWEYLRALFQLSRTENYKGTEIRYFNIVGQLNLYGSIVRNLFILSTSSKIIKQIVDFPQLLQSRTPFMEKISMTEVDLQTEINFAKTPQLQEYFFQLIGEYIKWFCKKNLVTLQNLLELSKSKGDSQAVQADLSDAETIQALLSFGGIGHPLTCPEGGKYYVEKNQVYCSIHNSVENYLESDEITENFFLFPLFAKLEKLIVQLNFTEIGILCQVNLFLKQDH